MVNFLDFCSELMGHYELVGLCLKMIKCLEKPRDGSFKGQQKDESNLEMRFVKFNKKLDNRDKIMLYVLYWGRYIFLGSCVMYVIYELLHPKIF